MKTLLPKMPGWFPPVGPEDSAVGSPTQMGA